MSLNRTPSPNRSRGNSLRWILVLSGVAVVSLCLVIAARLTQEKQPPIAGQMRDNASKGRATTRGADPARQSLFEEVPADQTGVAFVHPMDVDHPLAYLYHSGYTCGGVCVGDVNGDGLSDIFLVSGPSDNVLFINQGNFVFEKSLASTTLSGGDDWGVGASMSDVDDDGDLDLFVCNYDTANRLYCNDGVDELGRVRFTECGSSAGLAYAGPSQCPYFADFDADGDLDLFLLTNRIYSPFGRPNEVASELGPNGRPRVKEKYARYFRVVEPADEVPVEGGQTPPPFLLEYGHPDRLYRNEGVDPNGVPRFHDVTANSGIEQVVGHGLSALVWDVNGDGHPDVYVANDYTDPDRLWLNRGPQNDGRFRFRDATDQYVPYTTWFSMGSDVADVDGDGRLDFMVADMAATTHFKAKTTMGEMGGWARWVLEHGWPRQAMRNMLFLDSGAGRFQEAGFLAGVARSDWTWAVKFADFDLDGRNDLFLTNGSARVFNDSDIVVNPATLVGRTEWDLFRDKPEMHERNLAFRNVDGLHFDDVSSRWNLDKETMSYGAATGDLDGDGDLDLVVCNLGDQVSIYRNRASDRGAHWLKVRLEGTAANRFGVGALVTVKLEDGRTLVRLMNPQTGFLSVNEPILHFGLGELNRIEKLEVKWPSGSVQTLGQQDADQLIVVEETSDEQLTPEVAAQPTEFVQVAERVGLDFKHEERAFDDFQREFLLPGKQSQFGPGVAVADVNGDGLDDVFVGGAAGQAGALFLHQADHTFQPLNNPPWGEHAACEDMGALFFDADRDGDLDLYVVSGSTEWETNDPRYRDRLYLNESSADGTIRFLATQADLPSQAGSCVVGADFDRDGDVDLFIGARSIPGQYLRIPESTLLRNDGRRPGEVKFTDVTGDVSGLGQSGLVTSALWTDVDGNGWSDLLVTCEWGPVRLFQNHGGQLVEVTRQADLADRTGWWNSITAADLDGDGDIDYAALNVGLNTKYGHASAKKPALLYRGDMDHNGVYDLIEAKASAVGELPVRGRSCSCRAMPVLRAKFPTYRLFASANLLGIYTDEDLRAATKVSATEFESGVWINESKPGRPRFSWRALPAGAQLSPSFGAVAADFFGDGAPSLALAQNLFSREPETGLWRGSLGCLLRPTDTDKQLAVIGCATSGFVVSGDGKGLALADINADGWPDLIATQNNDRLLAFQRHPAIAADRGNICVRLIGPAGNPQGLGAKVRLMDDGQTLGTVEIQGGSGYLSQSAAAAFFARPRTDDALQISVDWPDGRSSLVPLDHNVSTISVKYD